MNNILSPDINTPYPQFGEYSIGKSVTIRGKGLIDRICKIAAKIWNALFHKHRLHFAPVQGNPTGPGLGVYVPTDVVISNQVEETLKWKKELIQFAEQSIELSANFAGGQVFRDVLDDIEQRMKAKPLLQVHLILSPDLLEPADKQMLNLLQSKYPNFHCLITQRIYKKSLCSQENHVKILIVDEKYFVTGGTGIHEKMTREVVPPGLASGPVPLGAKLIDKGFRDTDLIGCGDVTKTMRTQFFNLFRIWEHKMTGKARSRYFGMDASANVADFTAFNNDTNRMQQVRLKFIVSGPEHQKNPIVEEYSRLISTAKTTIKIGSLIFNPAAKIRKSLKGRIKANVTIKGCFNGTKKAFAHYIYAFPNRGNYNLLTHAYEYQEPDQLYHKKVMVVDTQTAVVGTANLGIKSAKHDYEAIVVMDDARVAGIVDNALDVDMTNRSKEYTGPTLKSKRAKNWLMSRLTIFTLGHYFG